MSAEYTPTTLTAAERAVRELDRLRAERDELDGFINPWWNWSGLESEGKAEPTRLRRFRFRRANTVIGTVYAEVPDKIAAHFDRYLKDQRDVIDARIQTLESRLADMSEPTDA